MITEFTPGVIVGLLLTLFIYTYLVRDNFLYRLAVHLLVGFSAAYAAVAVVEQVIQPILNNITNNSGDLTTILWFFPFLLAILLTIKASGRVAWLGNNALAVMIGIGAAVALIGAIVGTLWPQIAAASQPASNVVFTVITAILTIVVLLYFQFTSRGQQVEGEEIVLSSGRRVIEVMGQFVLTVTFGALFASILTTSLTLLTGQVGYFIQLLGF